MEKQLLTTEMQVLEHQEKQLLILIEELKLIQQAHLQSIRRLKQKLQLRPAADRSINAIKEGLGGQLTGHEMHALLQLMDSDQVFTNKQKVEASINKQNQQNSDFID
jgi:hypothetical protein